MTLPPALASRSIGESIDAALDAFSDFMWGLPLVVLLMGGGLFFMVYARGTPLLFFRHALRIVAGRYDRPDDPGQVSHFRALSSALAATVGMGNISGVAIAITTGGPGALFWMWVSACVGMATKFFTCSLAILYRGRDGAGEIQGGPMYFIVEGLGPRFKPLAIFFSVAGLFGSLAVVQSNQLTQILRDEVFAPRGWFVDSPGLGNAIVAVTLVTFVSLVIFGGIQRIALVASRLVPAMVVLYLGAALGIVFLRATEIPSMLALVFRDAFTGEAVAGGAFGAVLITGVRRAAFSNEAGIGTEAMAHGAARTREPIREGLVAMLGPAIDTLVVCNATAFVILSTGLWKTAEASGVTLTTRAFDQALPGVGSWLLLVAVVCFAFSTMMTYSYYGQKCASFLFGVRARTPYRYFYVASLGAGCLMSLDAVFDLIDGAYALMAIPTMTASLLLSRRVMAAARDYFARVRSGEMDPGARAHR